MHETYLDKPLKGRMKQRRGRRGGALLRQRAWWRLEASQGQPPPAAGPEARGCPGLHESGHRPGALAAVGCSSALTRHPEREAGRPPGDESGRAEAQAGQEGKAGGHPTDRLWLLEGRAAWASRARGRWGRDKWPTAVGPPRPQAARARVLPAPTPGCTRASKVLSLGRGRSGQDRGRSRARDRWPGERDKPPSPCPASHRDSRGPPQCPQQGWWQPSEHGAAGARHSRPREHAKAGTSGTESHVLSCGSPWGPLPVSHHMKYDENSGDHPTGSPFPTPSPVPPGGAPSPPYTWSADSWGHTSCRDCREGIFPFEGRREEGLGREAGAGEHGRQTAITRRDQRPAAPGRPRGRTGSLTFTGLSSCHLNLVAAAGPLQPNSTHRPQQDRAHGGHRSRSEGKGPEGRCLPLWVSVPRHQLCPHLLP